MFSPDYLDLFKSTIIRYLDPDNFFAYSAFTNKTEQMNLRINEKKAKVLIFDTRTAYINATKLVQSFRDEPTKEICNLTKSKKFKDLIDIIEEEINNGPNPSKKFMRYPNWHTEKKYFTSTYTIKTSTSTIGYSGLYIHPDLLIYVLTWSNHKLSSKLSLLVSSALLDEGVNETTNFDTFTEDITNDLATSITERKTITDKLEAGDKTILEQPNKIEFDIIQYQKRLNYLSDIRAENENLKNDKSTGKSNQCILVIDNYDDADCKFGSSLHRLTLLLINEEDSDKYMTKFMRNEKYTLEEMEDLISSGKITLKYDVVMKIGSLRDVPQDYIQLFVSLYEDQVEIWTERVRTKLFIMTSEIDKFKDCFTEFIGDWMLI